KAAARLFQKLGMCYIFGYGIKIKKIFLKTKLARRLSNKLSAIFSNFKSFQQKMTQILNFEL
nr:hypothetical protein [Escherichia coli]